MLHPSNYQPIWWLCPATQFVLTIHTHALNTHPQQAAPHEDVAERVSTMHAQERDVYAPPRAYFKRLEMDPLLAQWRRGAVRWFSKVGG